MRMNLSKLPSVGSLLFGGQRMLSMRAGGSGASRQQRGLPSTRLFKLKGSSVLVISGGDLTQWEGDAIVNAANERMLGGGGVDGAIHRAAGPQLLEACYDTEPVARNVRCPTGEARITPGFRLKAKHVIHTVGPIYEDHEASAPLLRSAFKSSLDLCRENGLKSVAYPAISCGVFGYPLEEAAEVAIDTILEFCEGIEHIEFVLFGYATYDPFVDVATKKLEPVEDGHESESKCVEDSSHAPAVESEEQASTPDGQEGGVKEASSGAMKEEQSEDPATGKPNGMERSITDATAEDSTRDVDSMPQGKEESGAKSAKSEGKA